LRDGSISEILNLVEIMEQSLALLLNKDVYDHKSE